MSIITDEKSRILPEKINFFDTGLENDRRTAEKCA